MIRTGLVNRTPLQSISNLPHWPTRTNQSKSLLRLLVPLLGGVAASLAGILYVIQHERGHQERLDDVHNALHASKRTYLYHMTDQLSSLRSDPKEAHDVALQIRKLSSEERIEAKRAARIENSLPRQKPVSETSLVVLHQTMHKSPATIAELAVMDARGRFVGGLSRIDFEVLNGEERVHHVQVAQSERTAGKYNVALLLDCSRSMEGMAFLTAKKVAKEFCTELANPARIQVWRFSDNAQAITPLTTDAEVLARALEPLAVDNGTALHLAIQRAAESLATRRESSSIVVLTDGEDSSNTITSETIVALCRTHRIPIHAVALGTPKGGHVQLKAFTEGTNGSFHVANASGDLTKAFRAVSALLREPVYRLAVLDPIDLDRGLYLQVGSLKRMMLLPPKGAPTHTKAP